MRALLPLRITTRQPHQLVAGGFPNGGVALSRTPLVPPARLLRSHTQRRNVGRTLFDLFKIGRRCMPDTYKITYFTYCVNTKNTLIAYFLCM